MEKEYSTLTDVENKRSGKILIRTIMLFLGLAFVMFFLPWTQNVRARGYVTTMQPDQRPQHLNSIIAGRIDQWFVREGDYVNKGDTILKISEIKSAYFDDQLLERTATQIDLKQQSTANYSDKIAVQENQILMLKTQRDLKYAQVENKLTQALLKVQNDSINFEAAKTNYAVAKLQYDRVDSLYRLGLKSKTNLEQKDVKLQTNSAYELAARNKWLTAKNEVLNLTIELNAIDAKYIAERNKAQSDQMSTRSQKLDAESHLNKLENTYSNYLFRSGLYYITAPQSGYITQMKTFGIGETIKEGEAILSLMPKNYDLAVELYVDPIDLPLIQLGEKVRIQFDGWPAIVFSGWPNASHGTYGGEIYAIDQFISENGKYRVLVQPDPEDNPWPTALRYGAGTKNLMMLSEVPIWYELWRNINGFPPEYYQPESKSVKTNTKK